MITLALGALLLVLVVLTIRRRIAQRRTASAMGAALGMYVQSARLSFSPYRVPGRRQPKGGF